MKAHKYQYADFIRNWTWTTPIKYLSC